MPEPKCCRRSPSRHDVVPDLLPGRISDGARDDEDVFSRVLAASAALGSVLYLIAYLWVIGVQDGSVAWWYVGLVLFATLSFAAAALGAQARAALTIGLAVAVLSASAAILSLGALLAPSIAAAVTALVLTARAPKDVAATSG